MRHIQLYEGGEWCTYELRRVSKPKAKLPTPAVDEAVAWLRAYLANGPKQSVEVYGAAGQSGHSPYSVRKALKIIGAMATKDGLSGGWTMRLPDDLYS